ncbi:MAG: NAD(P)/FAD-dependent oxidoreductase [Bacteroidota bacterium]
MNTSHPSILIIGAGLSGLTAAWLLKKQGVHVTLLEARNRLGGRIHTIRKEGEASVEMGATWLGRKHVHLTALLRELGLEIHEQLLGDTAIHEYLSTSPPQLVQLSANTEPSYRISGGTDRLIEKLAGQLAPTQIHLTQVVQNIEQKQSHLVVQTQDRTWEADCVISTLPPNLLVSTVTTQPPLPGAYVDLAKATHTWMGESIKVGFTYADAFWESLQLSATIISNVGPIGEMYDHSNRARTLFALKGFMNSSFYLLPKEERKQLLLQQLEKYYGAAASAYVSYLECVWREERYTFADYERAVLPHQNNGRPALRTSSMDGRLLMAGAETASQFPGYMDGAVESAHKVVRQVLSTFVK